jgi:hypothetical protein
MFDYYGVCVVSDFWVYNVRGFKTAYIALVRSIMEYGAIIWDLYNKTDINKFENLQRRGPCFITKDYKSREEGSMTEMLRDLDLPLLQTRRQHQRLIFFYKVVGGQIPAIMLHVASSPLNSSVVLAVTRLFSRWFQSMAVLMNKEFLYCSVLGCSTTTAPHEYISHQKPKRHIRARTFQDCETTNIVNSQVRNNTRARAVVVEHPNTEQYKNSLTVVDLSLLAFQSYFLLLVTCNL